MQRLPRLISLCDSIYMNPSATIITAVADQQPGTTRKISILYARQMRATAEANGRNPTIAEGMVDPSIQIEGITDSTKIITSQLKKRFPKKLYCEALP